MNERLFERLSQIEDGPKKLAVFLGIKPQTVNAWKSRKVSPPSKYISQIAEFLKVSEIWLTKGEQPKQEMEPEVIRQARPPIMGNLGRICDELQNIDRLGNHELNGASNMALAIIEAIVTEQKRRAVRDVQADLGG